MTMSTSAVVSGYDPSTMMKRSLLVTTFVGAFACGGTQPSGTTLARGGDRTSAGAAPSAADGPLSTGGDGRGPASVGEFAINATDKGARPKQGKLQATDTEAAIRFFVVDKDKGGGIEGIVISLTSPTGKGYYTEETDETGFTEVLVPIGQTYDLVYLSLGVRDVAAKVAVKNEPRLNLKLTMRYKREEPTKPFILDDVQFARGTATLEPGSKVRLDGLVEYMTHKDSARLEISGHTDNTGKKAANTKLSQQRADAVRDYLVSKGIDATRIKAVGHGDEKPIDSNDTTEGRQRNRRIEAIAF